MDEQADDMVAAAEASGIDIQILIELNVKPRIDSNEIQPEDFVKTKNETKPETITPVHEEKYNLRRKSRSRHSNRTIWTNKRLGPSCFRDRALTIVDINRYHHNIANKDEYDDELLALSKKTRRSQLDKFSFESRTFFIATWLTTIRIFEYDYNKKSYFEAKRIPHRYIDLKSNLISSVHFCDLKLYIAYISTESDETAAYVEVRDLSSKLLSKPYYYDQIVTAIESDDKFIYIKTLNNSVHIHHKNYFHLLHYRVDLNLATNEDVINLRARVVSHNPFTKLDLVAATSQNMILSKIDAFEHSIRQIYYLNNRNEFHYETISAHFQHKLVYIHRNLIGSKDVALKYKSRLEVGLLPKFDRQINYFILERTLNFEYHITQVEIGYHDTIFVFGYKKTDNQCRYELGCMSIKDFRPMWCTNFTNLAVNNGKILVQDGHVIIFKEDHTYISIDVDLSTENQNRCGTCGVRVPHDDAVSHDKHPGILSGIETKLNSRLNQKTSQL